MADFFPAYGTERETVKLLFKYRDKLKLEAGTYRLISLYEEVWNKKGLKRAKVHKLPKIGPTKIF